MSEEGPGVDLYDFGAGHILFRQMFEERVCTRIHQAIAARFRHVKFLFRANQESNLFPLTSLWI
jgi:hypothetical protein